MLKRPDASRAELRRRRPPGRSNSPAAICARRSRARLGDGIRTYRVRAHTRRLTAAMLKANPSLSELTTPEQIEAELDDILAAFIVRWLGKIPCA